MLATAASPSLGRSLGGTLAQAVGQEIGGRLRGWRLARGWTLEDVAVALHELDAAIGEPESRVDLAQVSKWERGVRRPGPRYQARLCVVFDADPVALGFVDGPRLQRDIADLRRRRASARPDDAGDPGGDRLASAVRHLWPADARLLDDLEAAARAFARRTETERPEAVLPDLERHQGHVDALLGRSHPPALQRRLLAIASQLAELAGYGSMVAGQSGGAWRSYASAEVLAREAGSGELVAAVLAARSRLHSRSAGGRGDPARAVGLLDAAEVAAGPAGRPALRAWVLGRRAEERAELGEELESGHDLDAAFRAVETIEMAAWNLWSDLDSAWLQQYRGARDLGLGQGLAAAAVFEDVLATTDRRLLVERAVAQTRLAWALALMGEPERAAELLVEAVSLTTSAGDRRGLDVVQRVREQQLTRWQTEVTVRRLDAAIRAARA